MARPLRIEFAGAIHHVTSRGNRQHTIFHDDGDRRAWLNIFDDVCKRFDWTVHAFCQMGNHFHLMIETRGANLANGMRQLNGRYTQCFNCRHESVGHLFQGRYHAVLVQRQTYLLELMRYVVLNPVRARMVATPGGWPWSSYAMTCGLAPMPEWLEVDWVLGQFSHERGAAIKAYREFVADGNGVRSPLASGRLVLGDDAFVTRFGGADKGGVRSGGPDPRG